MTEPVLRQASKDDAPAMLAIEQAATAFPWTLALFESCFGERYFNAVLQQGPQLLGFYVGEYIAGQASLFDIAVHPAAQGKGYGKLLLNHFIDNAISKGAFECWLEVRASNHNAIALYQQAGFVQTGLRPNYYPTANGKEDAVLMALPLALG